jgi:tetratricopeptide (TPR) repeat protein
MGQMLTLAPASSNAAPAKRFLEMTGVALTPETNAQTTALVQATLKAQPDYMPALIAWAAVQAQRGDKQVRQTYEQILARYPQFSPALKSLVTLPDDSAMDSKAYDWALKARKTFPGDAEVAKAVGRFMYKRGEFAAASTPLQEAVRTLTDDAEAHYYLGMARYKLGNQQQARLDLQRASALGLQGQPALDVMRVLGEAR